MNSRIIEFMPEREQSSENSSKLHNEISHIDIVLFCVIVVIEQQTQQHNVIFSLFRIMVWDWDISIIPEVRRLL
ncbi:hypothetical protein [Butyrivibrio proteoclasticus]|uniref:hypothetical protein n=1 Tax=Butyrivibrio proteoclasticus TaxID=43305 RepID=UPI00047E0AD7|nr:hypothetical protein [Butyrivibrio proteoclasticus]